jgi:SAM-dependent methyltransferase
MNEGNNSNNGKSHSNKSPWGTIKGPIFIGRTWAEYMKMFSLEDCDFDNMKILDCAAGASSFTAHMSGKGCDVMAVDLLYCEEPDVLGDKCRDHMEVLVEGLASVDSFVWSFFKDVNELKDERNLACSEFIQDYRNHRGRYVPGDLSKLPFEDDSFDLVLCSHLLFIYDHRLNYEFHLNSIKEMLRVSSDELRIYPLVKNKGIKSLFVNQIVSDLEDVEVDLLKVDYEFRRGGNEMMIIKK